MDVVSVFEALFIQALARNHKVAVAVLRDLKPCVDMYLSLGLQPSSSARETVRNAIFELNEILAQGQDQLDTSMTRRLVVLLERELDDCLVAARVGVSV